MIFFSQISRKGNWNSQPIVVYANTRRLLTLGCCIYRHMLKLIHDSSVNLRIRKKENVLYIISHKLLQRPLHNFIQISTFSFNHPSKGHLKFRCFSEVIKSKLYLFPKVNLCHLLRSQYHSYNRIKPRTVRLPIKQTKNTYFNSPEQ